MPKVFWYVFASKTPNTTNSALECGTARVSYNNGWVGVVEFLTKIPPDVRLVVTATPVYFGQYDVSFINQLGNCGGFVRQPDGEKQNKQFDICFYLDGLSKDSCLLVNWIACSMDNLT